MTVKYIDLFCGIGGFRIGSTAAFKSHGVKHKCVFSSDIDPDARAVYAANFGEKPAGDITQINEHDIPEHHLLLAGFPCQPFSIIGDKRGFEDVRGTLFFDIARILQAKRPLAFVLENVKQLATHQQGHTLTRILDTLDRLNYSYDYRIMNALDYGLPQKRERIFLVGYRKPILFDFQFPPKEAKRKSLVDLLEDDVDAKYYASEYIRENRRAKHQSKHSLSVWHENKAGNVCSYPYSCALRAGASYNYLLVNGERRMTEREMLRLQGFPDSYKIVAPYAQVRKQCGNAVPTTMVRAVVNNIAPMLMREVAAEEERNLAAAMSLSDVLPLPFRTPSTKVKANVKTIGT